MNGTTSDLTPAQPPVRSTRPGKQGLYDPENERDACGFGFVVDIEGRKIQQDPAQRHSGVEEPRPPGRLRLRSEHGRWCGRAHADAACLF